MVAARVRVQGGQAPHRPHRWDHQPRQPVPALITRPGRTAEASGAPAPACPAPEPSRISTGHSPVPTARPAPRGPWEAGTRKQQSDSGVRGRFCALMWQCSQAALFCSDSGFMNDPKLPVFQQGARRKNISGYTTRDQRSPKHLASTSLLKK